MKNLLITTAITLSAFAPALGHAMILPESEVAKVLGTRMPPSEVRVGKVDVIYYNSVYFYDNLLNITNRVLDRSIRADIVRVYTNPLNGETFDTSAKANKQNLSTHCESRLKADKIPNAAKECSM